MKNKLKVSVSNSSNVVINQTVRIFEYNPFIGLSHFIYALLSIVTNPKKALEVGKRNLLFCSDCSPLTFWFYSSLIGWSFFFLGTLLHKHFQVVFIFVYIGQTFFLALLNQLFWIITWAILSFRGYWISFQEIVSICFYYVALQIIFLSPHVFYIFSSVMSYENYINGNIEAANSQPLEWSYWYFKLAKVFSFFLGLVFIRIRVLEKFKDEAFAIKMVLYFLAVCVIINKASQLYIMNNDNLERWLFNRLELLNNFQKFTN